MNPLNNARSTEQTAAGHARLAGYAGLIPFVVPLLVVWFEPAHAEFAIEAQHAYAALILSFLGGIYWGLAMSRQAGRWFWLSVLPSLWAWPALLMPDLAGGIMLAIGFALMLLLDLAARRRELIREWFFRLRLTLSGVAIVSLALAMAW